MANLKIQVNHPSWTQPDIGPLTTALVAVLTNHSLEATRITWNTPTELILEVERDGMTYAQMQAFRTEFETGAAAVSAQIRLFEWNNI